MKRKLVFYFRKIVHKYPLDMGYWDFILKIDITQIIRNLPKWTFNMKNFRQFCIRLMVQLTWTSSSLSSDSRRPYISGRFIIAPILRFCSLIRSILAFYRYLSAYMTTRKIWPTLFELSENFFINEQFYNWKIKFETEPM